MPSSLSPGMHQTFILSETGSNPNGICEGMSGLNRKLVAIISRTWRTHR